ncbi:MAG: GNAT family N-acetyltransferase [Armatimonadota bacterium]
MTKQITYRSATADDCPGMLDLWRQFWSLQNYEANLPKKIEMDPELVIVAEVEGHIVGTIIGGFDGWWAWIYRVAVHKDYQGQGIASELFTRIHSRLKELGADGACLVSSLENESMQGLLKKLGYKRYSQAYFGHSL